MKNITVFLILFVLFHLKSTGQGVLNDVADSLKENVSEIVCYDHTTFTVEEIDKSYLERKYRAIIMDSNAELPFITLHYDSYREIRAARIQTFSLSGKERSDVKLKDFEDYSAKGSSLAASSRIKHYEVNDKNYPYIIEVSYIIDYTGSMFYPSWKPQYERQSIIEATLTVKGANHSVFRHLSYGVDPIEEATEQGYQLKWQVNHRKAFTYERYDGPLEDYAPVVYTAPNRFQMDGIEGNMSTWDGLGRWIGKLNKNQDNLADEQLTQFFNDLPEGLSESEKVEYAYNYLQQNTRYESIQLGIGGWKPFESGFVHDKKYGDCKALSFYTQSLLDRMGIKSYYTLIRAGSYHKDFDPDFSMSHFNHAILTVPMDTDTVWLECTSQTNPFGYMGTSTSDRNALMITEDGAKVIKTKTYDEGDNLQATSTSLSVSKDGSAQVDMVRSYSGLEIENNGFFRVTSEPEEKQKDWFYDKHSWGSVSVQDLKLVTPSEGTVPNGQLQVAMEIKDAASLNGDRLFFKPFKFTNINWMNVNKKTRTSPLVMRYAFSQVDTIKLTFPEGFFPENQLKDQTIENEYGQYHVSVNIDEGKYFVVRKFVLYKGRYEPSKYESFRKFIKEVQRNDRKRLVMLNKT